MTLAAHIWDGIDSSGGITACWPWFRKRDKDGYGRLYVGPSETGAHRVVLALALGRPLHTDELALHRCDNPPCCNPAHLYVGTQADNIRDAYLRGRFGDSSGRLRPLCMRGHPLAGANVSPNGPGRTCRQCRSARRRREYLSSRQLGDGAA